MVEGAVYDSVCFGAFLREGREGRQVAADGDRALGKQFCVARWGAREPMDSVAFLDGFFDDYRADVAGGSCDEEVHCG